MQLLEDETNSEDSAVEITAKYRTTSRRSLRVVVVNDHHHRSGSDQYRAFVDKATAS